ncbi:MAG: alpha-galactosidase [Candidatus Latescibacteria bacterium]|nr:alpha-galactosidase [Candidatus Latescibacterota bacterium]
MSRQKKSIEQSHDERNFTDIAIRKEGLPGVRYTSGLTIYDEVLADERLIGRGWSATGYVAREDAANQALEWSEAISFLLEVDGQSLGYGWECVDIREVPSTLRGTRESVIELVHRVRPVQVKVHMRLDGTPVITRWLEITNTSDRPAALGRMCPWCGLLDRSDSFQGEPIYRLGYFVQQGACSEGNFQWNTVPRGVFRMEGRQGRSGHSAPFFVLGNEETGQHFIGHLGWSANRGIEFDYQQPLDDVRSRLFFRAGPQAPGPQRIMAPGETIRSPEMHLGHLFGDLDDCVQAMHTHLRRSVLLPQPSERPSPVIYNHWGYQQHEMTEEGLCHEIDIASELGCELFIVDAGWFGNVGTKWGDTVGDWTCGDRLPNGLEPVFDYARKKGLRYGLWMEAERAGLDSKVRREHPEWIVKRYGKPIERGDLDFSIPEAKQWLEETIAGVIERYDLDLFRLDYNTSPMEGGQNLIEGYLENNLWRSVEAIYEVYDNIRGRFPNLLMENCSSGGGRTDVGLMRYFHHTWVTDWQVAPRSFRIFNGMSMALPPEYVDRNFGSGQNSHTRADLDFQCRSCMFGHLTVCGVHPLGATPNSEHIHRIKHHLEVYKNAIRPWQRTSRIYHHTPVFEGHDPRGWGILELVSADRAQAVAGLFRLQGPAEREILLRLRGLDEGRTYRVRFDNSGHTAGVSGYALMHEGITIALDYALTSELLIIEEA